MQIVVDDEKTLTHASQFKIRKYLTNIPLSNFQ